MQHCSYTQKSSERSRLHAGCNKKETGCTGVYAADTFDLQQVSNGGHGCSQVGENGPDFYRC